jgi:hypothetical protein
MLNVNAGASAYIKPELTVKIYSVAGPYANLKLYERLDANVLETPWWKLNAGIKMNAGVKVDVLDKFLLECTISDLINYEVLLAQATAPPIITPDIKNTTWDVTIVFNTSTSWHADVTFYADGKTKYDEPASPGAYLTYGIWNLTNDKIHFDIGLGTSYIFDGTITDNSKMSGTFVYGGTTKTWSAVIKK